MYRFVSSYLKPRGASFTYQNVDISLKTIEYIRNEYTDGYIELSNPALDDNIFITIQAFKELKLPHRLDHTFEYWLAYIKNVTIEGSETRPNYVTNIVRSRNAIQASFEFDLCKRSLHPTAAIAVGDMNDVYLRKENIQLQTFRNRSLTTVNGYLHPHVPYYDGVAIVGGGTQHKQLGEMTVGVLSFAKIGDIQMVPITPERISKYKDGVLLSDKVIIDTGVDLTDKSVIVSLGGFALISSPLVAVVSDEGGVLKIDTRMFDVVRHINNCVGEINLESCGIVTPDPDKGIPRLSTSYLLSDIMMQKYLTLPQSFIAIVDIPTLTVDRINVSSTGVAHRHIAMKEPNLPIMDSNGRLVEYWIDPQNGPFSIMTRADYYKNFLYETTKQYEVDNHTRVLPVSGFQHQSLDFLQIVSVRLVE